jgi:hypothetical protein
MLRQISFLPPVMYEKSTLQLAKTYLPCLTAKAGTTFAFWQQNKKNLFYPFSNPKMSLLFLWLNARTAKTGRDQPFLLRRA